MESSRDVGSSREDAGDVVSVQMLDETKEEMRETVRDQPRKSVARSACHRLGRHARPQPPRHHDDETNSNLRPMFQAIFPNLQTSRNQLLPSDPSFFAVQVLDAAGIWTKPPRSSKVSCDRNGSGLGECQGERQCDARTREGGLVQMIVSPQATKYVSERAMRHHKSVHKSSQCYVTRTGAASTWKTCTVTATTTT